MGELPLGVRDKLGRWRERRRHPRHRIISTAWVRIGDDPVPRVCVLWDISESGARLALADPIEELPNHFNLSWFKNKTARRDCEVVWMDRRFVAVKFTAPTP